MNKKMSFMQKVKTIAVPVTSVIVPLGVGVLSAAATKQYAPSQDKKYKEVLQNIAIGAITSYISHKVTEHAVEGVESQCDELDDTFSILKQAKEVVLDGQN